MRIKPSDMLDKAYLKERAKLIDLKKAKTPAFGQPSKSGTVYLCAADESGMMVGNDVPGRSAAAQADVTVAECVPRVLEARGAADHRQ